MPTINFSCCQRPNRKRIFPLHSSSSSSRPSSLNSNSNNNNSNHHIFFFFFVTTTLTIMSFYYRSMEYQKHCAMQPIIPSLTMGGALTALDVVQGASLTPQRVAVNVGGLYLYHILQCPMEAFSGRPSALHNVASGGIIGYLGVSAGMLGVPFLDHSFFMRNPRVSPPMAGAVVYGSIAGIISTVMGGKPL